MRAQRWNSHAQRCKGTTESAKSLNAFLDCMERQVHDARRTLLDDQKEITAEAIKNVLTGQDERPHMVLEVFKYHNEQLASLVGKEYAPDTLQRYTTSLEHTRSFIKWKYNVSDLDIKSLNFEFLREYEYWFKSVRNCNHNTAIKYLTNFRKIVNRCIKNGWLIRDPFFGFKMNKKEVIREYLSEEELQTLTNKEFAIDRLRQVRDTFLFCCYTGLAFVDIFNLKPSEIAKGIDGNQWIFTCRQKTETPSRIPLLPPAQEILNKYKDNPKCVSENRVLPVLSNQKMNAYLKEIADVCGITKTLTFHIARHTFATIVTLSNGVPIETVSKMLGHKSIKITQHYAKIIDLKVSEDMLLLQTKLQATRTLAI